MRRAIVAAATLLLAAVFGAGVALAAAPEWTVDADASQVGFTAHQMQVSIPGQFPGFTATIRFAADDLAASSAEIVIDVAGVETPNRDVEDTIKLADWFDVTRFPNARFEATEFVHVDGERYDVGGLLTLRDVTHPVTVPFTVAIGDDPDEPGMLLARAAGEVTVGRLAFGIGQGKWENVSVVSDEVVIQINLVARRPKP